VTCGAGNDPPCLYSTIQRLQIDETNRTATFSFHQVLPSYLYSNFGGNTENLPNGDLEYALSGVRGGSPIFEVTNETAPRMVWSLTTVGSNVYRGFRMPSLYAGVQW
jgi:arylsulfate sulfotransferase